MRYVMIAGPNPVEIMYTYELPDVFAQFSADEIGLWVRTEGGELSECQVQYFEMGHDDVFRYFRAEISSAEFGVEIVDFATHRFGRVE